MKKTTKRGAGGEGEKKVKEQKKEKQSAMCDTTWPAARLGLKDMWPAMVSRGGEGRGEGGASAAPLPSRHREGRDHLDPLINHSEQTPGKRKDRRQAKTLPHLPPVSPSNLLPTRQSRHYKITFLNKQSLACFV